MRLDRITCGGDASTGGGGRLVALWISRSEIAVCSGVAALRGGGTLGPIVCDTPTLAGAMEVVYVMMIMDGWMDVW